MFDMTRIALMLNPRFLEFGYGPTFQTPVHQQRPSCIQLPGQILAGRYVV
jgi:hypothetical protein